MSEKNKDGSYTHTPSANDLSVFDPNVDLPAEPPPSYDEAMADPSINDEEVVPQTPQRPPHTPSRRSSTQSGDFKYSRPPAPPPNSNPNRLSVPTTSTGSSRTSSMSSSSQSYSQSYPPKRPMAPSPQQTSTQLPKPSPINPNPYLPWRYPSSYRCSKCENTGYKKKNGHPCKTCWGRFRPQTVPPSTRAELERIVKHRQAPKPINTNVYKLPPGATILPPTAPVGQGPVVVKPGDPRIGGVLCTKCNGRGMVHFFLDLERCSKCNGLGRIGSNGRPL